MATFNPNWAAIAQILGGALGAPDGQWGQGAAQGAQSYQQMQGQKQEQQYREQQMQIARQQAEMQKAEFDRQAQQDAQWQGLWGSTPQAAPPRDGDPQGWKYWLAQPSPGTAQSNQPQGFQTATDQQQSPFGNLTPQQRALLLFAGRDKGISMLPDMLKQDAPDAPTVKDFYEGGNVVQKQWDGTKWVKVGEGARWQPNQGPSEPERVRLAKEAGLVPGTPEYTQFLLGRDDTPTGPFQGTGLDQQAYNIVLTGDPKSPEYAAAYAQLGQPKVTMDPNTGQMVSVQPDLSWARKPGGVMPAVSPNVDTTQVPGATITSRQPDTMATTPEQRNKFKQQSLAIDNLESALTEYEAALDKYGSMETYGAGKGVLETAYANVLIQAKEAANLGALTGPDMEIMNQTIIAPNSVGQATVGGASGVKAQMQSVRSQLKQKRANLNTLYGPQSGGGTPPNRIKVDKQGNVIQ